MAELTIKQLRRLREMEARKLLKAARTTNKPRAMTEREKIIMDIRKIKLARRVQKRIKLRKAGKFAKKAGKKVMEKVYKFYGL